LKEKKPDMKIDSLYIDNYKLLNDFRIDFKNGNLYNPITVITGINGSGKTTLLRFIHEALTSDIFRGALMGESEIKIYDASDTLNDLYIKMSGSSLQSVRKASENNSLNENSKFFRLQNRFKKEWNVLFYESCQENTLAELFIKNYIDKLIYEEDIVSSEAYSKMREVINKMFEDLNMQIEFDRMDKDKNVYFRNSQYNNITLKDLSGGERTILTKILPLYLHDYKDGVILIDEPETSLHPNWQFQIIELYKKIAERNNNQFIIATHSPQIVASIEQESLRVLVRENDKIRVIDSDSNPNPFGKRLDEVLLEVFQVNSLRTPLIESKIERLKKMLSDDKYETNDFVSMLNEVKGVLSNSDSDLLLINLELARKKKMNEKNN
jgi:predicted ATP-binding protein involved in virulence